MTPAEYRRRLDRISIDLLRLVLRLLVPALRAGASERTKRAAAAELTFAVRRARAQVGELTAEFMRAQARAQGVDPDDIYVPPVRGYAPDAARTVIDQAVERRLTAEQVGPAFVRHAEQAGRDMVEDAAEAYPDDEAAELNRDMQGVIEAIEADDEDDEDDGEPDNYGLDDADDTPDVDRNVPTQERVDDRGNVTSIRPVAWARQLTGADNCAFCVMLASRGAVYKYQSTAVGRKLRPGQNGDLGYRYHDRCDCIAIPVYSSKSWPGKAESERLYRVWLRATKGYGGIDALNALRRELYRMKKQGVTIAPDIRKAA